MTSTMSRKRPARSSARRPRKIGDMTENELKEIIATTVEGKLVEWFGDPEDVRDEQEWARQYARSHAALERMADEGLAALEAGKHQPLDPDHL